MTSLFAASSIADGTVISELRRQHRAVEFKRFLTAIDKAVPVHKSVQPLEKTSAPGSRPGTSTHGHHLDEDRGGDPQLPGGIYR